MTATRTVYARQCCLCGRKGSRGFLNPATLKPARGPNEGRSLICASAERCNERRGRPL